MKSGVKKRNFIITVFSIIGIIVFFYLFPKLYPGSHLNFTFNKEEIIKRSKSFLNELGYQINQDHVHIKMNHDNDQLRYLNKVYGSERTNRIINDSIPVYYWELSWSLREDTVREVEVEIGSDAEEEGDKNGHMVILKMDLKGRPLSLEADAVFEQKEVKNRFALAREFANKFFKYYPGRWIYDEPLDDSGGYTRNNIFKWHLEKKIAGEYVTLIVNFKEGDHISIDINHKIPKDYAREKEEYDWFGITSVIIILFFIILVVIHFIRRLRADMIDLRRGIMPGIIVSAGYVFFLTFEIMVVADQSILEALIAILIVTPFIGGGLWILYSIGLAVTRDAYPDKLIVLDAWKKKRFFPDLGRSILQGMTLVFIVLGVVSLLEYVGVNYLSGYFKMTAHESAMWSSPFPSLLPFISDFISSFYIVTVLFLFFASIIKQYFNNSKWIVIIVPVVSMFMGLSFPHIFPLGFNLVINLVVGIIFSLFFIRYDFFSVVVASMGIPVFIYGTMMLGTNVTLYIMHGFILYGIIGLLFIFAILCFFGEPPAKKDSTYVPPYLKRVYERERIKRELEIAREVQASFLPREKPQIQGIDVATLCLPAREIGGDYYDFIELGKKKLGVAIGDVSGKGTSAAFYMTLTKGFFKSQAKYVDSPMQVLKNMNELFYDNVERGVFISMIYSIFDLEKKQMTFSRAGHNPMILRRSGKGEAEEMCPAGIALGLERGYIFSKTIQQKSIPIHSGDVFLFYTDGLNEALNPAHEEYGETRLRSAVEKNSHLPVELLLDNIEEDIYYFTGRAPQYDDMTAVVIKIK